MRVEVINENTCIIYCGERINEETSHQVQTVVNCLYQSLGSILIDVVPSYTSILLCFDLDKTDYFDIKQRIHHAINEANATSLLDREHQLIEIPVYYGLEVAYDLEAVSQLTQLTHEEVINIHLGREYRVYAIGFSPGFSYLGSLDKRIVVPRKAKPRLKVPTGSVGLADNQTAIYPSSTPGGWQIIGRTPIAMLDWQSKNLTKLNVGDRIRFKSVSKTEYHDLGGTFDGV
ncbi:allophanate hydrolase [Vibrio sp. 10N.286.49.B3]|uniref:5-oxoprolinase subunit PxpB n=1 Tax=Vibrio sp. 10N.286.49.B3 TaxID=1880855 RepID=UPI000C856F62|nr:5-oxoprolinase subunit PxpB [Vibrio sp. 10N.286.49.B3]PMH44892.1 allophanate hydrolase [Vibrio sp. 10N.286.49.B3]